MHHILHFLHLFHLLRLLFLFPVDADLLFLSAALFLLGSRLRSALRGCAGRLCRGRLDSKSLARLMPLGRLGRPSFAMSLVLRKYLLVVSTCSCSSRSTYVGPFFFLSSLKPNVTRALKVSAGFHSHLGRTRCLVCWAALQSLFACILQGTGQTMLGSRC
jgi:hypothetical protein